MATNKWPKWLPYPVSWARASVNFWCFGCILESAAIPWIRENRCTDYYSCVDKFITVITTFVLTHFVMVTLVYLAINKVREMLGRSSKVSAWKEGLNGVIVVVLSAVMLTVVSPLVALFFRPTVASGLLIGLAFKIIPFGAYLYQYDFWARERKHARQEKKVGKGRELPSPTASALPTDPIDLELDRMRGEMGLNQMRKPKDNH
jgi:hypothetical protein